MPKIDHEKIIALVDGAESRCEAAFNNWMRNPDFAAAIRRDHRRAILAKKEGGNPQGRAMIGHRERLKGGEEWDATA